MNDKQMDEAAIAEIAAALKAISLEGRQLEEMRRLYETPQGFPYTVDKKNAPQGETIEASRKVGSRIKKALGVTSEQPYGMNYVGYCDPASVTWRMRPTFRAASERVGIFEAANGLAPAEGKQKTVSSDFQAWLKDHGSSTKTASNYAGAISGRLAELAKLVFDPSFSLSLIDSKASFERFCKKHDKSGKIVELNATGKDMYRRALVWYAKFLGENGKTVTSQSRDDEFRANVDRSLKDSTKERAARLAKANKQPRTVTVTSVAFERNPDVVAQVLLDAKGKCQGCGRDAPFKRKSDNTPYLEVHHRQPLSEGGEDTVANAIALCPNCHRKAHYG